MNSGRRVQKSGKLTYEELQNVSCRRLNNNLQGKLQHKLSLYQSHYKSQEKFLKRQTSDLREQQAEYQLRLRTCSLCNGYRRSSPETPPLPQYQLGSWSCASSSGTERDSRTCRPTSSSTCGSICRFCSTSHLVFADCAQLTQASRGSNFAALQEEDEMPGCRDILDYYNNLIDRGHTKIPW